MGTNVDDSVELVFQAVLYKNVDLLKDLLQATPELVNCKDSTGRTPLHLASERGYTSCAKIIIDAGGDVNADLFACDTDGNTALQSAQIRGFNETAELLMTSIEQLERKCNQIRASLYAACIDGDVKCVKEILKNIPTQRKLTILNGDHPDEKSALYICCEHGRTEIINTLLSCAGHRIIYSPTGDNILHAAVLSQVSDTVKIIVEKFSFLMDAPNNEGSMGLHWACRCGNVEVVQILLESYYPENELKIFENTYNHSFYKFVCDLNSTDNEGRTPLFLAVAHSHSNLVNYLISYQLSLLDSMGNASLTNCPFILDSYSNNGRTPLMVACANGNEEIAWLLLEHKADPNLPIALTDTEISNLKPNEEARCTGSGALYEACRTKNLSLVRLLLKHGALDYDNKALTVAAATGNSELISTFLSQLCYPDSEYRINKQPFDKTASGLLNNTNLLANIYPSTACQINWHNANLETVSIDWLSTAVHKYNTRLRNSRSALLAITRLDLASNRLKELPPAIFQMQSLRILDLSQNFLSSFDIPSAEFVMPSLESLSIESNYISVLPEQLFSKNFPLLKILNVSKNRIKSLPKTLWLAPALKDLNLSHNEINEISTISGEHRRKGGRQNRPRLGEKIDSSNVSNGRRVIQRRNHVDDQEILRINAWQKKIQISNIDDTEETDTSYTSSSFSNALRNLNLSGNKLTKIPSCLSCCCPRLTRLDLSMNEIAQIGPIEFLPSSLRHLNLGNNRISKCFIRPDSKHLLCEAPNSDVQISSNSYSVNRHSRSRSKSVARNQRSLSVIKANEENDQPFELCAHRTHARFEALKTLNLSHNQLSNLEIFVPFSHRNDLNKLNFKELNHQMRTYLVFPALTNLDISHNNLRILPQAISLVSQLAVLNISNNRELDSLPPELGLLTKLWNISLKDCPLKEPLYSIVNSESYKTLDLVSYLRNKLDNSKSYPRMKLMILGGQGVGKTSLLNQLRNEGSVSRKSLQSESWSRRMGHSPSRNSSSKNTPLLTINAVDVAEWRYKPKGSSKSDSDQVGEIIFRTWDFDGRQKENASAYQYFLTRRSLYLVVWKVTDGEIALNEIHQWLLGIQARAPNSTVIIVGTHYDYIESNAQRFPAEYMDELDRSIRDRFVSIPDSEKKGLPRVVASVYVSSKTRHNIRPFCSLLYHTACDIRSLGRKHKLLAQKVPASYVAFEKVVVNMTDELRAKQAEPVLKLNDFWALASSRLAEEYGRSFRDTFEFRQACDFLHENGILLHYDDNVLNDYCFLDPPWFCAVLVATISEHKSTGNSPDPGLLTVTELSGVLRSVLKHLLDTSNESPRQRPLLKSCILPILSKFELALPCLVNTLLIPSRISDEYLLRADYPGAKLKVRTKFNKWALKFSNPSVAQSPSKHPPPTIIHRKLIRILPYQNSIENNSSRITTPTTSPTQSPQHKTMIKADVRVSNVVLRRLYVMQYIPLGFWPRLLARLLDDDKFGETLSKLFVVKEGEEVDALKILGENLNAENKGFEWLLWQTGAEISAFNTFVFSLKQFLPLACVRDINYSTAELYKKNEDGHWRSTKFNGEFLVELLIPLLSVSIEINQTVYDLNVDSKVATRVLAIVVNIIDDLLEDWFPFMGTRFMHTSEGFLLVDRLVACPKCASNILSHDETKPLSKEVPNIVHLFSIEDCIFHSRLSENPLVCPQHERLRVEEVAPDVIFVDLSSQFIIGSENIKRGKLVGRGAFGFVFLGFMKHKNEAYTEVALKVLEPVEEENDVRSSAQAAFEAFRLKWRNDAFENGARAYCIARQELSMLTDIQHPHTTCLLGFCAQPLTLSLELAPLGALDQILSKYRRSNVRLSLKTLQQTSLQIAKALEYLHTNRIIYKDLKSENVLVWRFPPPHSTTIEVHVKLGDYGISRHSYPSGVCKGYGGTEGFMAPEIMRYNGEREYTEKVDSFSFGMFMYELVSLKQPYDRQEQMKDFILEGGRPFLTDKELLFPSNVLDLMVVCWAESAEERPSSSQLVEITAAPEFIHLLDVTLLNSEVRPEISAVGVQEPELEMGSSDPGLNYQCLLPRSDNAVELFSFNQFGWIDSKIIRPVKHTKKISALHFIEENIWIGDASGNVRIVCAATLSDLFLFSVFSLHPSLKNADPIILQLDSFVGRQIAIIVLKFSVILCSYSGPEHPKFLMCIELSEAIHVLTIIPNSDDWQIWTGHDQSRIFMHHITAKNRLLYSNSVLHTEEKSAVNHLVSSLNCVWSSLRECGKVFLWENSVLKNTLNCQKLLPMSESLSSMNVESIKSGHVTAMALTEDQEQLVVGTSAGVLIVVQAKEMIPFTVFRPFASEIERILCHPTTLFNGFLQRELSQQSISSMIHQSSTEHEPMAMKNSSSASPLGVNDIYGAMNRVKERFSNMIAGQKSPQGSSQRLKEDYFVTIGTEYRSLLERFSQTSVESEESIRNRRCAIVWKTDDWIK